MTQQKSENRIVPEGGRKVVKTRGVESRGGGKAVPVKEADQQLSLALATAENPLPEGGAEGVRAVDLSTEEARKVPKARAKLQEAGPATMDEVIERLSAAFEKVAANRGAPGPDRRTVGAVREHWPKVRGELAISLRTGTYQPGDIRRVWIPKSGGGERGLGIPNVVDRVVQEAVRSVLEPLYEPTFHPSSHGFRPGRSCHTALAEAQQYVEEGHHWVVDMDLAKFFDRVHHQRLMSRLAERVHDRPLLVLIGRMLKAKVVMPDGVRLSIDEGVPQGGPLSPLLSNVVLSELDEELGRRGLRFVRYADDCNIYVRSERAGLRVMASIVGFISKRLRLEVNASKSAVARPETRHFLGFRLLPQESRPPQVLLSERSKKRLYERIRELTPRNCGRTLKSVILDINVYLTGWFGFFRICTKGIERVIQRADAHIRRRLRAIVFGHWKTKRTSARRLILLGVRAKMAWRRVYEGRKGIWRLSYDTIAHRGMRNTYFTERGFIGLVPSFREIWETVVAPGQLELPLGPARS